MVHIGTILKDTSENDRTSKGQWTRFTSYCTYQKLSESEGISQNCKVGCVLLSFSRLVQIQAILFWNSMAQRDGYDIQRLWNWMMKFKIDSKSTEDDIIQIQSRSMSDPPLCAIDFKNKMEWVWSPLWTTLKSFHVFIVWKRQWLIFLSLTDALSDQPNVKSLSDMKPGIISKKIDKNWFSDFKTSFERSKKWIWPCGIFQTWTWKVLFFIQFCTESYGPKLDTFLSI